MVAVARQWLWFPLMMLMGLLGGAGQAQTPDVSETVMVQANPRVQALDGRVSNRGLQLYRMSGLTRGSVLYVHAEVTSGHLDPLVALLKPDASQEALSRELQDEQIKILSRAHDPLEVARQILDRYALAWNDDYQGHYHAALKIGIPADGDYWLVVGSSLVRGTAGGYRLTVGIDAPEVLTGQMENSGPPRSSLPEKTQGRWTGVSYWSTMNCGKTRRSGSTIWPIWPQARRSTPMPRRSPAISNQC